jgi:hypothetical protein
MGKTSRLEAMWELAHVMDVVFRPDRSEHLDIRAARPLLERMVEMMSDDDPRIPGVMGLAEVARSMLQVDRERALELFRRWFEAGAGAGDSDSMTQAAVTLAAVDPEAGQAALRQAHDFLIRRVDCPSMGDYCRRAAPYAPELVLSMAPHIPDRRERSDALSEAAISLYKTDAARALGLVQALERPVDRSSALLRLVDGLLDTTDRPEPQPLMEEMP